MLFDVALHMGTFLATIIIFHKEIYQLLFTPRAILLIIVGSIPAAIVGFTLVHWIETELWNITIAAYGILFTGTCLLLSRSVRPKSIILEGPLFSYITVQKAFWIGVAQSLALLPGVSRSGMTITCALFLKTGRKDAATFSFILSLPAILGAFVLKLSENGGLPNQDLNLYLIGFLLAFVVGLLALACVLKIVLKGKFYQFGYYCWFAGIISLIIRYTLL